MSMLLAMMANDTNTMGTREPKLRRLLLSNSMVLFLSVHTTQARVILDCMLYVGSI